MDHCSMSIFDKPPQIIILTRVSFQSFSYLHQSSFIWISGSFNHDTVPFFACQAACLMECMEGGNDASRIEVLKLIILSLMFVFFVYILDCFIVLLMYLCFLFICLSVYAPVSVFFFSRICFLNTLKWYICISLQLLFLCLSLCRPFCLSPGLQTHSTKRKWISWVRALTKTKRLWWKKPR